MLKKYIYPLVVFEHIMMTYTVDKHMYLWHEHYHSTGLMQDICLYLCI